MFWKRSLVDSKFVSIVWTARSFGSRFSGCTKANWQNTFRNQYCQNGLPVRVRCGWWYLIIFNVLYFRTCRRMCHKFPKLIWIEFSFGIHSKIAKTSNITAEEAIAIELFVMLNVLVFGFFLFFCDIWLEDRKSRK